MVIPKNCTELTTPYEHYIVATSLIYAPMRAFTEALSTLKEIDQELVNINKVTNMTVTEMQNLAIASFDVASAYGRTSQDYLSGVAEFARAGYEAQSTALSEMSLLAQNVGELTADQANSFLIATDAAYKFKGSQEELGKVLDGVNQIDNKFATSIQKVSEGVEVAGSIASNAGVGVDELSAAVGTMTAVTQKTGNEAGRAFRGILMNIRQVKGETEDGDIIDDAAISKSAAALDDVGIKVHELRNGVEELRNPMDVLKDLANVWDSLSTMKQAPIIEALGGKYRGNQLLALVENFDMYESMLTEYSNAAGSAMKENEVRMDSWQSKANQLTNSMNAFWYSVIDTNTVKSILDSLNSLFVILKDIVEDPLTSLVVTMVAATASAKILAIAFTALSHGAIAYQIALFKMSVAQEGLIATTKLLTTSLLASPLFWVAIGSAAIWGIVKGFDALTESSDELSNSLDIATKSYKDLKSEVDSLNDTSAKTLSETAASAKAAEYYAEKLDELSQKTNLTSYEQAQMRLAVSELNSIIPSLNLSIDSTTGKLSMQSSQIKQNIEDFKNLSLAQAYQSVVGEKYKQLAEAQIAQDKANARVRELQSSYTPTGNFLDMFKDASYNIKVNKASEEARKMSVLITQLNEDIANGTKKVEDYSKGLEDILTEGVSSKYSGGGTSSSEVSTQKDILAELDKLFEEKLNLSKNYIEDRNFYEDWEAHADDEISAYNRILAYTKQYYSKGTISAEKYATTVREISKAIYTAQKELAEKVAAFQKESLQKVSDAEDEIVKMYEWEKDQKLKALEDEYDAEMEVLDKKNEEQKSAYQDDLNEYTEYINSKKQALEDSYEKETFEAELADKQKELAEIQSKINELALSAATGDRVAIQKTISLQSELGEKQSEIDKFVAERSNEIQQDALDKALSDYEDHISDKQDELDDEYEREKARIKNLHDVEEQELEEAYNKQKLYSNARKAIMSGEYSELETLFSAYQQAQGSGWSSIGQMIQSEFIDKLSEAKDLLKDVEDESGVDLTSGNGKTVKVTPGGTAPKGTKVGDVVVTSNGAHAYKVVGVGNTTSKTGGAYNSASNLTSIQLYDTGGSLPSGAMASNQSGKPEHILNPEQTEAFDIWMRQAPQTVSALDNIVNGMIRASSALLASTSINSNSSIQIDTLVRVEGNADENTVQKIADNTKTALDRFASQIGGGITLNKGLALI